MILSKSAELNHRAPTLGGKAWRLIEMQSHGLPVPPFFVVTAEDLRSRYDIASYLWPESFVRKIELELRQLGGGPFAVRSSASDEDGEIYSFAGQLRTHLNRNTTQDVLAAIKDVWASAFSPTILAYRQQRGMKADVTLPSVIVQKMVASEVSGVLFTADPVTGDHHTALLSFAPGLGDAIVDGAKECTEATVDLRTLQIKLRGVTPSPLSEEQIRAVTRAGEGIAQIYQRSQDIEWCWKDNRIYVVQARPITSASVRLRQGSTAQVFDNSNIQESFCGITLPLTFSFASGAYYHVYSQLMRLAGFSNAAVTQHDTRHRNMLSYVDGRVFYNIQSWYEGLKLLPSFGRNKEDMERMMGVEHPVEFVTSQTLTLPEKLRVLPKLLRALGFMLWSFARIEKLYLRFSADFERNYSELNVNNIYRLDAHQTLQEIRGARARFLARWSAPILNDFYVMIYNGKVRRALAKKNLEAEQPSLLVGEDLASTAPTKALLKLATRMRKNPELRELLLKQNDAHAFMQELQWRNPELKADLAAYIAEFGDRVVGELKLESLALWQDPTFLFDVLRSYVKSEATSETLEHREIATRQAAEALVFKFIPSKRFRKDLARLREGVRFRESMRFKRTRAFGVFRRLYVHLGEVLFRQGALVQPRDIFYLTEAELEAFIEGRSPHRDLKGLVQLRQQEFARYELTEPPNHFRARLPIYTQAHFEVPPTTSETLPGAWQGIGCYAGIVRAEVVVLTKPERDIALAGKILCTLRTDPGWAPLFINLAGLLVEKGSSLSHSAVVARELGLPVVVGAPDVTKSLQTGDWIEMNGATGRVQKIARPANPEVQDEHTTLAH